MVDLLLAGLGLVILLLAGDALVRGAVNLSLRLGVPALIVSLTIVAFGTSAPELLIAVKAILEGSPGIALGNVVGSNTANILMVLGLPALLYGLHTENCDTKKTYVFMLVATVAFIGLAFFSPMGFIHGLILLALLAYVLWDAFREAQAHRAQSANATEEDLDEVEGADPAMPGRRIAVYMVLGLIGLPLGADLLVDGAVNLARTIGVSETAIGLSLVAIGTSLPELATTLMAAYRRQADVALGNVIGSNMFNLLAIMGVATLVGPVHVDMRFLYVDFWVMLAASLALLPFVFMGRSIGRVSGGILTALYVIYLVMVLH